MTLEFTWLLIVVLVLVYVGIVIRTVKKAIGIFINTNDTTKKVTEALVIVVCIIATVFLIVKAIPLIRQMFIL